MVSMTMSKASEASKSSIASVSIALIATAITTKESMRLGFSGVD
jgi:hypothetical protein